LVLVDIDGYLKCTQICLVIQCQGMLAGNLTCTIDAVIDEVEDTIF
jgi:hypothetical protein